MALNAFFNCSKMTHGQVYTEIKLSKDFKRILRAVETVKTVKFCVNKLQLRNKRHQASL